MTPEQAAEVVGVLMAAYPTQRQKMTQLDAKAMALVYIQGLADLDATQAKTAVNALVLSERWIPTIAQIRAKATEHRDGRKREGAQGWSDCVAAIKRYGYARTPGRDFEFADPMVAQCVKALGWGELCNSENAVADRARFVDLYDQLATSNATDRSIAGALPSGAVRELPSGTRSIGEALKLIAGGKS